MTFPLRKSLPLLLCLAITLLLILTPTASPPAVKAALTLCLTVLIPSLFPMFVLTDIIITLSLSSKAKKGLLGRLFCLSACGERILLLSLISGFPHAARLCASAVETGRMTGEEADRITAAASIPGAAFVIGGIGRGMLGDTAIGVKLYLVQIISALLFSLALRLIGNAKPSEEIYTAMPQTMPAFLPMLAEAIKRGATAMLSVCGAVTFFSILRSLLTPYLPLIPALMLSGFLEITSCASSLCALLSPPLLLPLLSALLSFSGCSVHAQVALCAAGRFRLSSYLPAKLLCPLISLVLTFLFVK